MRRPLLVLVALLVVLALSACGGRKLDASKAVATATVDLPKSYRFSPDVIKVKQGTTVTWTNHDNFTHSVRFKSGPDTETHVLKPGQSLKLTFPAKGDFRYECTFHSHDMQGEVVVQ